MATTSLGITKDIDGIAELNPIRYRSYYYDIETDLYYLNSRYYNPETGRFINSDDVKILIEVNEDILVYHLYAYCLNNPVFLTDTNGCFPQNNIHTRASLEGTVGSYSDLRKMTAGNPMYEVHHILEIRFYKVSHLGAYLNNPQSAPSVILLKSHHRALTSALRSEIKYGSPYTTMNYKSVLASFDKVYSGGNVEWINLLANYLD